MATSLLEQLKRYTVVVCDTGDFKQIEKYRPRDATTNPSLIAAAAKMPEYDDLVVATLRDVKKDVGTSDGKRALSVAVDRLFVAFGCRILDIVPGRVSTEVDARLSYDIEGSIKKARELIALYNRAGITNDRVLIKLASTWEGIRAAEILEKEGIHCNMTLLFGFHQAVACAEAKVTLISPFVGRILDWYMKSTGRSGYLPSEDPGVVSVRTIYEYYKRHGYRTEVMGASFRNLGEIVELAGCDLLTISPKLLGELEKATGALQRKLDPGRAKARGKDRIAMNEAIFRKMHANDRMATEKLDEGIKNFSKDLGGLEEVLEKRLASV